MNMMQKLLAALCLIGLTSSIALAADETVDLGTTKVSMDLLSIGPYNVEKDNPSSSNHNYGGYSFTYQLSSATITASNTGNRVMIGVYQMSIPEPLDVPIPLLNGKTGLEHAVEESGMMPSGNGVQKQQYYVDGHKGMAMIINRDQKGPVYLASYSPDMKDGSGKTIVIIGSDFPLNTTKSIFESFKTQLAQDNMIGQGNMGQSSVDQSNTGMNNMGQTGTGQSSMGQSNMGQDGMSTGMSMMNMGMDMMRSMMGTGQGSSMGQGSMMM